jgi:tRNA pseudouridine65 synthase
MKIEVLYEDEWIVAVNKPDKLQTHSTPIDPVKDNLIDFFEHQQGARLFPLHRLDRSTSGVLLLSKNRDYVAEFQKALNEASKKYIAIIRGKIDGEGEIEREMKDVYTDKLIQTKSTYKFLQSFNALLPFKDYPNREFSIVELEPITGKTHQLRRHMAGLSKPIIGDMEYGDSKLNKYFRQNLSDLHMLLHAKELSFTNPYNKEEIHIEATIPIYFEEFRNYCSSTLL